MKNDGWIEWKWTEEKPYPETLDTKVWVRLGKGWDDSHISYPMNVGWWHDDNMEDSSWYPSSDGSIVAYKVAE